MSSKMKDPPTPEEELPAAEQETEKPAEAEKAAEKQPEPEQPDPEPEQPEDTGGNMGTILLVLAIAAVGGGAGWYFKVYRPKQQRAAEAVEEDYGEELDAFDDPEDDTPPWDEDEV